MFHGEKLQAGTTYVMVDPNQSQGQEYLGTDGWTSLDKAKRFTAEEASQETDGPGQYLGWISVERAITESSN